MVLKWEGGAGWSEVKGELIVVHVPHVVPSGHPVRDSGVCEELEEEEVPKVSSNMTHTAYTCSPGVNFTWYRMDYGHGTLYRLV